MTTQVRCRGTVEEHDVVGRAGRVVILVLVSDV